MDEAMKRMKKRTVEGKGIAARKVIRMMKSTAVAAATASSRPSAMRRTMCMRFSSLFGDVARPT